MLWSHCAAKDSSNVMHTRVQKLLQLAFRTVQQSKLKLCGFICVCQLDAAAEAKTMQEGKVELHG